MELHQKDKWVRAGVEDRFLLSELGAQTFKESHGHSASENDISDYISRKFTPDALLLELQDPRHYFFIYYHHQAPVGYVKIIPDCSHPELPGIALTKLERLYVLKDFYGTGAGQKMLDYAISLSRQMGQKGMWLYVWKENYRAIAFYQKNGFVPVGSFDFEISPTHVNPNHRMLFLYPKA